jgi:hypothetical protein
MTATVDSVMTRYSRPDSGRHLPIARRIPRCQPDAIWAKKHMAELSDAANAAHQVIPGGAPALTTAELAQ